MDATYIKTTQDIEKIVVGSGMNGAPVTIGQLGQVTLGPEMRRGIAELNGQGEVAGGIVVMRHKENALDVIKRIKAKLKEIEPGLPKGVKIVTTYDRSDLIEASIGTVRDALVQELIIVSLMLIFFLTYADKVRTIWTSIAFTIFVISLLFMFLGVPKFLTANLPLEVSLSSNVSWQIPVTSRWR